MVRLAGGRRVYFTGSKTSRARKVLRKKIMVKEVNVPRKRIVAPQEENQKVRTLKNEREEELQNYY